MWNWAKIKRSTESKLKRSWNYVENESKCSWNVFEITSLPKLQSQL
jgi:hypothetical protein